MGFIVTILIAIVVFGLLIFIHELGHYSVAKFCKIKIDEFAIGMGPKLFGFKKGETLYSVRMLPIGGYVKMDGEDKPSENERAFSNKPAWQRLLVVLAGAFMNIFLGFILMLCLVSSVKQLPNMEITKFKEDAISNSCGLKVGDKILKIGDYKLKTNRDLKYIFLEIPDGVTDVVVDRSGEILKIKDVKFPVISDEENNVKFAFLDFEMGLKNKTIASVINYSFNSVISDVKFEFVSLYCMLRGKYDLKAFAGPVQIVQLMATVSSTGIKSLISFVVMITVNLGIFNLLPLPALDGGRIMFLLIEICRKKPINQKWEGYIHLIGFALFMLFAIIITYNDIIKLLNRS